MYTNFQFLWFVVNTGETAGRTVLKRGNALCQVQCASRVFKIAENQKFSQDTGWRMTGGTTPRSWMCMTHDAWRCTLHDNAHIVQTPASARVSGIQTQGKAENRRLALLLIRQIHGRRCDMGYGHAVRAYVHYEVVVCGYRVGLSRHLTSCRESLKGVLKGFLVNLGGWAVWR